MASTLIVDQLQKTGGSTTALTLPTSNASADEFLQNDGAGALSWASAGGGFLGVVTYTGSGTYTPRATTNGTAGNEGNANVTKIIVGFRPLICSNLWVVWTRVSAENPRLRESIPTAKAAFPLLPSTKGRSSRTGRLSTTSY